MDKRPVLPNRGELAVFCAPIICQVIRRGKEVMGGKSEARSHSI